MNPEDMLTTASEAEPSIDRDPHCLTAWFNVVVRQLQSRVAQLETQRDQLEAELRDYRTLVNADPHQICMYESYCGVVKGLAGERVVVVYETDDDPMEHVYDRAQFIPDKVPNVGDQVKIFACVACTPPDAEEAAAPDVSTENGNGPPKRHRRIVNGPHHEF